MQPVVLSEVVPSLLRLVYRVPEADGGGDEGVSDGDSHDEDVVGRGPEQVLAELGSQAVEAVLVHSHKVPPSLVPLQDLGNMPLSLS